MSRGGSLGCTGALAGVLVVAMLATLAGELAGPGAARGGVTDSMGNGRRMAHLLLEAVDLESDIWTGDPLDLAESPVELLWMPALPMGFREKLELSPEEDPFGLVPDEEPLDHRRLRGLGAFLARGGDLVLPADGAGSLDLAERLLGLEPDSLGAFLSVRDGYAEGELETGLPRDVGDDGPVEVESVWSFSGLLDDFDAEDERIWIHDEPPAGLTTTSLPPLEPLDWFALAERSGGEAFFAVTLTKGGGRLVLVSEHDFWTNLSMPEADNALAFVRLVEHLDRPVWFDETVLLGHGGSWLGYLLRPPLWPLTLAALVLALLAGWRTVPRRGFALEERMEDTPAPLARARGRAGLLLRADRPELLARDLVAGVRARLGDDDEALERRLRAVAPPSAEGREAWLARARRALGLDESSSTPKTTAGLEELGATLAAIETRIQES